MKIIKNLYFPCFILTAVFAGFNGYAADQSICHADANVIFYNDGSLQSCRLKSDYDVNSIQCKKDGPVSFYGNGNLESCVLSTSASIGMINCKQNGQIIFYVDGKLKSCMKPGDG
jgi:hypothetical protein